MNNIDNKKKPFGGETKKIDNFLFIALIVLTLGFLIINIAAGKLNHPKRTDLVLSEQWETIYDKDTLNRLIHEFEDSHPELRIRQAAQVKNQAAAAKNNSGNTSQASADIILFDDSIMGSLIRQNALSPLNSYIHGAEAETEWAIPMVLSMDLLFYNVDLLQSAGFDRPPKTREELITFSRVITLAKNDACGTALGLSPEDPFSLKRDFFSWLWAAGFPLVIDGKPILDTRAVSDLISFIRQINSLGPDDDLFEKTGEQRLEEFMQGKLAMIIAPANVISSVREQMGEEKFGITVIPGLSSPGKTRLGLSGYYAGIDSASEHPDEAGTFLAFLAEKSPGLPSKIITVPGSLPGIFSSAGIFPGEYIKKDPLYAKAWEIFESSGVTETISTLPQSAELELIVFEELSAFFGQDRRPQDTAAAIQRRWDSLF